MRLALVTDEGRITPVFEGSQIMLVDVSKGVFECQVINTDSWKSLSWGKHLMQYDVETLLCSGIEQFEFGMIKGHGIAIIPDAMGNVLEVLEYWRRGILKKPHLWPHCSRFNMMRDAKCRRIHKNGRSDELNIL